MIRTTLFMAVLGCCVTVHSPAAGEEADPKDAVVVTADSLSHDQRNDALEAKGSVVVSWGDATLRADRVTVHQKQNEAHAEGTVSLRREDVLLKGDRISVNYRNETGEVENGDLLVEKKNFRFRSPKMSKVGADEYRVEHGAFTTCDGPDPSWEFTAREIRLTLDEFAIGKNAFLRVGGLPVFYTPYIIFPVKRERQSGFLFPEVGSSQRKGLNLILPYYWAISPSKDATFDLDVQTKRGVGLGTEVRYLGNNKSNGLIRGYLIYDTEKDETRGDLSVRQHDVLTSGADFRSDLAFVLDRDFYRDYGETSGIYNRQLLDSSLSLNKRWESAIVAGELRYLQDLYAPNDDLTLQRLPTATGNVVGQKMGDLPVYASLASEYTRFDREAGPKGNRFRLHPSLRLFVPSRSPLHFSLWGGYQLRGYDADGAVVDDGFHGYGRADAGGTIGTVLEKVAAVSWGNLRRVRHSLIPEIRFEHLQHIGVESLPFYDLDDREPGGTIVSWSLANFVAGRFQYDDSRVEYRDLVFLRLSQGYQLGGSRRDLLAPVDVGRPFTDIRLEARITPGERAAITGEARYNPYDSVFSTAAVGMTLADDGGNTVGGAYRSIRGGVEYLEAKLGLHLVNPLFFNYTGRYSIDSGEFLESYYSLELKRQCWSVVLAYRDRLDDKEIMLSFTLTGVGSIGPVKAL